MGHDGGHGDDEGWSPVQVEEAVRLAAGAAARRDTRRAKGVAAALVGRARDVRGVHEVLDGAGRVLTDRLASLWEGGWQPHEVAHQARRRRQRGALAMALLTAAMGCDACWARAGGAAMPPDWTAALEALGVEPTGPGWVGYVVADAGVAAVEALEALIGLIGALLWLPPIDALTSRPSSWGAPVWQRVGRPVDSPVLAKVRALLAKAESTQFEAEAEALTAKAQELMARHAIDEALAASTGEGAQVPATRRVGLEHPYADAKASLLARVASSNGVRCVHYSSLGLMALVGFAADLDATELLFTSLLTQATAALVATGAVSDSRGHACTRSFRQSFLLAFAVRIGERLEAAVAAARSEAEAQLGADLLPALAARSGAVDEAFEAAFPRLGRRRGPRPTNPAGWLAGCTAAELATLGVASGALHAAG